MSVLFLTEDDVRDLIDMPTAIEVVEEAFRQLAEGRAHNVPRRRAEAPGIVLHQMSAAAQYLGHVGFKAYTTTRAGARFHVVLYDAKTGEMQAIVEADQLGRFRTGAASGVATEFMARPDAKLVGVFGTGKQARTQLQAVCCVRQIERVEVYGRDDDARVTFAEEMTALCDVEVEPASIPDFVAAEKDVVITATSSRVPVFEGKVLEEGTHLNVIGSNWLGKSEIDVDTVRVADRIVCDSVDACQLEAGDFVAAIEAGVTEWTKMHDLADVITSRQTPRATPEEITLFKSVGLAIEDVALAAKILETAQLENVGRELPL